MWCYECDDWVVFDPRASRNQLAAEVGAAFAQSVTKRESLSTIPSLFSDGSASSSGGGLSGSKKTKWKPPVAGLGNLGNTCFFNSVIQCLTFTEVMAPIYLTPEDHPEVIQKGFTQTFLKLLTILRGQLVTNKPSTVSPNSLFSQIKMRFEMYRNMGQQDAHELLRTLMDALKEEQKPRDEFGKEMSSLDPETGLPVSFVDKTFGGKLLSVLLCSNCRRVSYRFEEFLDLSISVSDGTGSGDDVSGRRKFQPLSAFRRFSSPKSARSGAALPNIAPSQENGLLDSLLDNAIVPDLLPLPQIPLPRMTSASQMSSSNHGIVSTNATPSSTVAATTPSTVTESMAFSVDAHDLFRSFDSSPRGVGGVPPSPTRPQGLTLVGCLENFLNCDVLDGDNGLLCEWCNGRVSSDSLARVPDFSPRTWSEDDSKSDDEIGTSVPQAVSAPLGETEHQKAENIPATKIRTNGFKRFLIHTTPQTLVIHLKRFERAARKGGVGVDTRMRKVETHVAFNEYIDVGAYLSPHGVQETTGEGAGSARIVPVSPALRSPANGTYRLYGVVVHMGSLFGGHYVAYVRVHMPAGVEIPDGVGGGEIGREVWCCASDHMVKAVSLEHVLQQQAYLLFYERV
ncbi:ubiquitin-specific protease ubp2 [Entophlyctis luteolus]|nr:ubiquitin-specific protease ubp2 [Entophlyctis luteolus]